MEINRKGATMKYYICPKCSCINELEAQACANCNLPTAAIILLPNLQIVEFDTIQELDRWIKTIEMMGGKVWRKKT